MPVWIKMSNKHITCEEKTFIPLTYSKNTEILVVTKELTILNGEKKYGFYYNTQFDEYMPSDEKQMMWLGIVEFIIWYNENYK